MHAKFKRTKSRYNKNKYHQSHGKAQKKAVVHWSSSNIQEQEQSKGYSTNNNQIQSLMN